MSEIEYKVFHGIGVVVADVKSDTLLSVLAVENLDAMDYNTPDLRFLADMTRTPNRTKNWDRVQFDDRGIESTGAEIPALPFLIGKQLPVSGIGSGTIDSQSRGAFVAGLYIEYCHFNKLKEKHFPWMKIGNPKLTSIVARKAELSVKLTRYHGFIATVDAITDTHVTLTFADPDHAVKKKEFPRTAILTTYPKWALCEQDPLVLEPSKSGVVFIELKTAVQAALSGPKVPIGFMQ